MLIALVCALTGAAPASALDRPTLSTTLAKLQPKLGPAAGAYVVDLGTGQALYARGENLPLAPASNEKLFVTAAALLRFGADATLPTTVRPAPGATIDANGVLHGDLYLIGGGDPTLGDPGLERLAQQIVDAGVTKIDGAIRGDESLFDTLRGGPDSAWGPDFDLGGWLSALSWRHGRATPGGPALAAAARLAALLKADDVTYAMRPRIGTLATPFGAAQLPQPIATLASPPMRDLIAATNVESDNFYAEMLAKALGARFGAAGSTHAGLAVVNDELNAFGVHPRMVDGSGLSRANRTTARQVVRLLDRMHAQEQAQSWMSSLAVAGKTGTLRKRMRGTAAAGRCRAKTGTLIGVSALSGYCTTTGGASVAFSFIENRVCNWCAKKVEDRMVTAIAKLDG